MRTARILIGPKTILYHSPYAIALGGGLVDLFDDAFLKNLCKKITTMITIIELNREYIAIVYDV